MGLNNSFKRFPKGVYKGSIEGFYNLGAFTIRIGFLQRGLEGIYKGTIM